MQQEEIKLLTKTECQKRLKELERTYDLKTPLIKLDYTPALIDEIANEILYLEDRIDELDFLASIQTGLDTRAKNRGQELPGIMTPRGRADSIAEAARLMGYSKVTIHTYLITKRDEYFRCE